MPLWCVQDNECLACTGGCEGYETKHEAMRERRLDFWRRVDEIEAKETKTMGHCPQEYQAAQNTDTCLHSEPYEGTLWHGWENKMYLTRHGDISISIGGHVITKTMKQWHTLAADDFKRQEEIKVQSKVAGSMTGRFSHKEPNMDFGAIEERIFEDIGSLAPVKPLTFAMKLASLLNEANKENGSNTPDFVLAEYLTNCLGNFEAAAKAREKFYGVASRLGVGVGYEGCTITKMDDEHTHAIELNDRQVLEGELWPMVNNK